MQTKRKSIRTSQSSMPIQRIDYFPQYSVLDKDSLKEKYHAIDITITLTDGLSFILDVIIIVCLYVNHFQYNKNKYSLSKKDNIIRIKCLVLSVVVLIMKVIRRVILIKKRKQIEYVLKLRTKVPKPSVNYCYLFLEIITHLIQPLPYVAQHFKFSLLDVKITYSADLFLFFFHYPILMQIVDIILINVI